MSHPFGDLLAQYLHRKHGLSQSKLAAGILQAPSIISEMCKGKRLSGPQARGRIVTIIGWLQQQGALDTLDEADALLNAAGMSGLNARGPTEAKLIAGLRIQPLPQPTAPPALRAPHVAPRHNLPAPTTSFIGHERELNELRRLLVAGGTRLLTLTGSGGVGKTRLALQLAAEVVDALAYPDGVWLVEFGPLADPAFMPQAVAAVLGAHEEPARPMLATLVDRLRDRELLLLLDNCEHLIDAVARLADALLRTCPDLRILATSREGLAIAGEQVWRVHSLETPGAHQQVELAELAHYEAVRLFDERARLVLPTFALTTQNAPTVQLICSRLDGIPLAIEMAAARVATLSPQEIAARLDDRFALLTSGRRTALPRQRTLQATLDWSYQLLSAPERVLLARLSVFADGCTADGAQTVCADAGPVAGTAAPPSLSEKGTERSVRGDVLPLLLELVHKSLVVADTRGGVGTAGQTRFRLLETVRQFGLGKLSKLGEVDAAYERLAAYLLAQPGQKAYERTVTAGLDQLEAELGNARALMAWARARPDKGAMSLRLATAWAGLWVMRGHLAEPQVWLEEALAHRGAVPAALRAEALNGLLRLLWFRGYNLARWAALAEESLALSAQIDDAGVVGERFESLFYAGMVALARSDLGRVEALFEQGLALAQRWEYSLGIFASLAVLGVLCLLRGDRPGAISRFRQGLQVAQEAQDWVSIRVVLSNLAMADLREALTVCERELVRCRAGGRPVDLATILQARAQLLLLAGEGARARATLEECLALWRTLGVRWNEGAGTARTLLDLGQAAWLQGDPAAALARYEESLEQYRHVGDARQAAHLHVMIGHARLAQGDLGGAAAAFGQGLELFRELGQQIGLHLALTGAAALAEARGQGERAALLFAAAVPPPLPVWVWPADRIILEREVAAARQRLDTPALAAAWAEGEQMTLEQAVTYALAISSGM